MTSIHRHAPFAALLFLAACGASGSESDQAGDLPRAEPAALVEQSPVEAAQGAHPEVERASTPAPTPGVEPIPAQRRPSPGPPPFGGRDAIVARTSETFDRLDANGDGSLDAAERAGGRAGGRFLERLDADNDGRVTRQEALDGAAERFRAADTNGDGVLSDDERPAGMRPPG